MQDKGELKKTECETDIQRIGFISLLILIFVILPFLSSCSYYNIFSSNVKSLDFNFEYPRSWETIRQPYEVDLIGPIVSSNESGLKININVWLENVDWSKRDSEQSIKDFILQNEKFPNFDIIRQENIDIDGYKGDLAEVTYNFPDPVALNSNKIVYVPTRDLDIIIPRKGIAYEIWVSASQNEWIKRQDDISHVLATFRWK